MDTAQIMKLMYGRNEINDKIILTPLDSFYDCLCDIYETPSLFSGWYKSADINCRTKKISLLSIPQGSASSDTFKIVEEFSPLQVLFLGYCGALNKKLEIGDVIQDAESKVQIKGVTPVTRKTVNGMLDKDYSGLSDIIEMELSYAAGVKNLSTLLVVSDLPLVKPFYKIEKRDKLKIKEGVTSACNLVKRWIKC